MNDELLKFTKLNVQVFDALYHQIFGAITTTNCLQCK